MTKSWLMTFLCVLVIQGHVTTAASPRISGPSRPNAASSSLADDVTKMQDNPQRLQLPEPPQILEPKERNVTYQKKDSSVLLNCVATGFPKPTYQWTRYGEPVPTNTQYYFSYSNGTLHIPNLSKLEQGYFQCSATNRFGKSLSEVVEVRTVVEGKFELPGTVTVKGKEGQGIQIPCSYKPHFDPPGSIDWYTQLKGQPGDEGNQVQIKKDARIYVDTNGTLYITRLEPDDEKNDRYHKCAVNSVDQSFITLSKQLVTLTVERLQPGDLRLLAPTLMNSTTYLEVVREEDAIMECIFAANPDASLTWFDKDGKRIVNSSRTTVTDFGRRLRINKVTEDDEGNFRCHASNTVGDTDGSVYLNVTGPPVFIYNQTNVLAPRGGEATFVCRARCARGEWPLSPPKWFINGTTVEQAVHPSQYSFSNDNTEITFRHLTDANTWCVQCNVTNQRGYAFWDRYLKVIEPLRIIFQPNRTVAIREGQQVELTVVASSDQCCRHQFAWQLNKTELTESAMQQDPFHYDTYGDSARLRIDANTTEQVLKALGTYSVIVFHPVYRSNQTVDVIVHLEHVPPDEEPLVQSTTSLWWLGIVFGLLFLVIVGIIIFLMIHYNFPRRAYFLEKEELKHKLDPKKDILDQSFTEM